MSFEGLNGIIATFDDNKENAALARVASRYAEYMSRNADKLTAAQKAAGQHQLQQLTAFADSTGKALPTTLSGLRDQTTHYDIAEGLYADIASKNETKGQIDPRGNAGVKRLVERIAGGEQITPANIEKELQASGYYARNATLKGAVSRFMRAEIERSQADTEHAVDDASANARHNRAGAKIERQAQTQTARAFNITDDAEFQDQLQQSLLKHKFFSAEWLNDPLGKAEEQLELETLKAKKALDDYYKKAYKTVADDIFKDSPLAKSVELRDIFRGVGAVDGKSGGELFNSANVSKDDKGNINLLGPLDHLLKMITGGLKGPAAAAQIDAAKTQIAQMAQMVGPLTDQIGDARRKFGSLLEAQQRLREDGDKIRSDLGVQESEGGLMGAYVNALVGNPSSTDFGLMARLNLIKGKSDAAEAAVKQINDAVTAANASLTRYGVSLEEVKDKSDNTPEIQHIVDAFKATEKAIMEADKSAQAFALTLATLKQHAQTFSLQGQAEAFRQSAPYAAGELRHGALAEAAQNGILGNVSKQTLRDSDKDVVDGLRAQTIRQSQEIIAKLKAANEAANVSLRIKYEGKIDSPEYKAELAKLTNDYDDAMQHVKQSTEDHLRDLPGMWSTKVQQIRAQIDLLKSAADQLNDGDALKGFMQGLKGGALKVFSDLPSNFELGMNAMSQGLDRFGDLFSKMAMGMKVNFKQATASILADIGQMIIKMIILKTLETAFMAFSGGGVGGGAGGAGSMAGASDLPITAARGAVVGGAHSYAYGGTENTYFAYGGATNDNHSNDNNFYEYGGAHNLTNHVFNSYAYGGAHYFAGGGQEYASHADLLAGGVKPPGRTTHAIFGEGTMPEAFVPMMDRRTVQVAADAQRQDAHSAPVRASDPGQYDQLGC
jgi:hypothetical protein